MFSLNNFLWYCFQVLDIFISSFDKWQDVVGMVAGLLEVKTTTCLLFASLHPLLTGKSLLKTLRYIVVVCCDLGKSHRETMLSSDQFAQGFVLKMSREKKTDSPGSLCNLSQSTLSSLWKMFPYVRLEPPIYGPGFWSAQVYLELLHASFLEESCSWMLFLGPVVQSVDLTATSFSK